jgi:carboxylesterase
VLALHGFGGTPLEVELAVSVARKLGLEAMAPLLPGHGTSAQDLATRRFADWVRAAEAAFDDLARRHGRVIAVGLSMGAMLAGHLAGSRPDSTVGLVLMANAYWLASPFPAWPLRVIHALGLPDFSIPKAGSDIGDAEARRGSLTYNLQPIHAAIDLMRAGDRVRADLARVRCPTLILHGKKDRVCSVSNAEGARRLLGTRDQRVVIFPNSRHILTRDAERAGVAHELERFFARFQAPVEP